MRTIIQRLTVFFFWFVLVLPRANAQVPSSIAGDGFLVGITTGTYPLASYGYYIFLPANSGNSYQTIGIYGVTDSVGTYTWAPTSSSTGQANISDTTEGYTGLVAASFSGAISGSFNVTTVTPVAGYYQNGNFNFSSSNAPSSLAGLTVICAISDGAYPFAYTGSATLQFAVSGNTYTSLGDGVHTVNSSGTYSYSLANRSTGKVQINDSLTGASTVYLGLADSLHGGYASTRSAGGFQIGGFTILDTTPPNVTISSPTSGQTFSTSSIAVSGVANDSGNASSGVSLVEVQVNGTNGVWQTANGTTSWSVTVGLQPGANTVYVRAHDGVGNYSTVKSVNVTYNPPPPPSTPTALAATNISASGFTAKWNSSSGANGYRLDVSTNNAFASFLSGFQNLDVGNLTAYGVTGLSAGSVYYYRVSAYNSNGTSSNSSTITVATLPDVPIANAATGISAHGFTANWSSVLGATGYRLDVSTNIVFSSYVSGYQNIDTGNVLAWNVTNLAASKTYYYRLRAYNGSGASSNSSVTTLTTMPPYLNFNTQGINMVLSWSTNDSEFYMEVVTNTPGPLIWVSNSIVKTIVNRQYTVTKFTTNGIRYYRLRK